MSKGWRSGPWQRRFILPQNRPLQFCGEPGPAWTFLGSREGAPAEPLRIYTAWQPRHLVTTPNTYGSVPIQAHWVPVLLQPSRLQVILHETWTLSITPSLSTTQSPQKQNKANDCLVNFSEEMFRHKIKYRSWERLKLESPLAPPV